VISAQIRWESLSFLRRMSLRRDTGYHTCLWARYRCGGPYSFLAHRHSVVAAHRRSRRRGQQFGLGAMTTCKATPTACARVKPEPIRCCRCATIVVFPHIDRAAFRRTRKNRSGRSKRRCGRHLHSCRHPEERVPTRIRQRGRSTRLARLRAYCKLLSSRRTVKVWVRGRSARKSGKVHRSQRVLRGRGRPLGDRWVSASEAKALARSVTNEFESYVKLNKRCRRGVGIVSRSRTMPSSPTPCLAPASDS